MPKTRILVISDTHGINTLLNNSSLPSADVILHCGDLSMKGSLSDYKSTLNLLSQLSAPLKLVIAGNHDFTLDPEWWTANPQRRPFARDDPTQILKDARELWTGSAAKEAGVTFLDEGTHSFNLSNGAKLKVFASPYQPEFYNWAYGYPRTVDRFNPPSSARKRTKRAGLNGAEMDGTVTAVGTEGTKGSIVPKDVDVMMTHGPPWGYLDQIYNGSHVGCEALTTAIERVRPKVHAFGHIHEGWGVERVTWNGTAPKISRDDNDSDEESSKHTVQKIAGIRGVSGTSFEEISNEGKYFHGNLMNGNVVHVDASDLNSGQETLLVNAAIMTVKYRPSQMPIVVDLDLPSADPSDRKGQEDMGKI